MTFQILGTTASQLMAFYATAAKATILASELNCTEKGVRDIKVWPTDGGSGRLLSFDRTTGHATFNFRPARGGLPLSHFFEERQNTVASFAMKKSHWAPS